MTAGGARVRRRRGRAESMADSLCRYTLGGRTETHNLSFFLFIFFFLCGKKMPFIFIFLIFLLIILLSLICNI